VPVRRPALRFLGGELVRKDKVAPRQAEWETDYEFVPRIDGIPTGDTANVRLYRVSFQFGEILPLYPKPV